jgi:hypothetical protein
VSLFLPYPPSSRSFIVIVDPSFYLVFPLSFFPGFLFLSHLAAAGMVPFPSKFQRDGSYIPSGLSGREPWPCTKKKFILSYLLSSRPRVYRSLGKSLERPSSLKFPSFSRPSFPFFLEYSVSLLRVENSRTHLPVLDFSFCRQSLLRSVFLRQDWLGFFFG